MGQQSELIDAKGIFSQRWKVACSEAFSSLGRRTAFAVEIQVDSTERHPRGCTMTHDHPSDVQLVRVTTDDRQHLLWVAAVPREEAVGAVLAGVPEGWTTTLLSARISRNETDILNLNRGECREITFGKNDRRARSN